MTAPMPNESLESARDCIASVRMLPPLPTVAVQIVSRLGDEFIDGNEVADVVAQDPAICARLISLANSAYFGLRTPVGDLRDVVNRVLGADTVRSMALALASQNALDTSACASFDVRRFWRRALGTAACCKRIAAVVEELAVAERECAYAMGLCHDLGLMALVSIEPARMSQVFAADESRPVADRVHDEFGFTPPVMTLALAEHWELPLLMIETFRARVNGEGDQHSMAMVLRAAIRAAAYAEREEEFDRDEAAELLADDSLSVPGPTLVDAALPNERQQAALDGAVETLSS
ncbi:MAG: HDOD domain-containing protein [Pseudomonadota bacterium]